MAYCSKRGHSIKVGDILSVANGQGQIYEYLLVLKIENHFNDFLVTSWNLTQQKKTFTGWADGYQKPWVHVASEL